MSNTVRQRLAGMTAREARVRATGMWDAWRGRVRGWLSPPEWRRDALSRIIAVARPGEGPWLAAVQRAARQGDWAMAHGAILSHVATGPWAFPPGARAIDDASRRIRARFPFAADDARRRASAMINGDYDLLGFARLDFGSPPDWHLDPAHGRRAPLVYWADVPYLDPSAGDHKIIWEINRHQHWLVLGRAFRLTGDRRFYDEFVSQLESWLRANPPLMGTNWASMLEIAFRTLSWLWALQFFATAEPSESDDTPWAVDLIVALDRQLGHIERHVSRYFSPNTHLTGEALALYACSRSLPWLRHSRRRGTLGREILIEETRRQVRKDGGHVEQSAHYHRYSTDFYLLALAVARQSGDEPAARAFEDVARRQARYLRAICDDRGRRPSIGDDDGGQLFPVCGRPADDCRDTLALAATLLDAPWLAVGPVPEEVFWFCGRTGLDGEARARNVYRSQILDATGYCVSRTTSGDHLVFDAGAHGFLNGGHAHADALAVVLTLEGSPFLVDPGTATYTMDAAARDHFRSTAMHNTLVLADRPQSVPRGPFHWETQTDAQVTVAHVGDRCDYFEGHHDAYWPIAHTRAILAIHGFGWFILDHVLGDGPMHADVFWHLHPSWTPDRDGDSTARLHSSARAICLASSVPLEVLGPGHESGLSDYSPAYGRIERSHTLRSKLSAPMPATLATWVAGARRRGHGGPSLTAVPVRVDPGAGWHAAAFRLAFDGGTATLLAAVERTGRADRPSSAPGRLWGTNHVLTDARVALSVAARTGAAEVSIVNGSTVIEDGCSLLELPSPVSLIRLDKPRASPSAVPAGVGVPVEAD